MLEWILQNLTSLAVLLVVIIIIALVVIKMITDKKRGKSSCGGHCGGCPMKENCHIKK